MQQTKDKSGDKVEDNPESQTLDVVQRLEAAIQKYSAGDRQTLRRRFIRATRVTPGPETGCNPETLVVCAEILMQQVFNAPGMAQIVRDSKVLLVPLPGLLDAGGFLVFRDHAAAVHALYGNREPALDALKRDEGVVVAVMGPGEPDRRAPGERLGVVLISRGGSKQPLDQQNYLASLVLGEPIWGPVMLYRATTAAEIPSVPSHD